MSKMMVKRDGLWTPMENLKGDTGPLPADNSVTNDALVTDGAKTNTAYLMGNRLTKDAEGEFISVDDSYPSAALSLTVDGKSTQVTTTGKNLFNKANLPLGYYRGSDGVFVSNNNYRWWSVPVTEGDVVRYTNCPDCIMTYYLEGVFVGHGSQTWTGSYTVPTGVDEVRGYCAARSWNTGIVTLNNSDLTYEPYTGGKASPSPDYPQEIVSVENPKLMFVNKNLLNPGDIESGYITGTGDSPNAQQCRTATKILVTPGASYVSSFTNGVGYVAYFYANWNDSIRKAVSATLSSGRLFKAPAGCNYVRLTFGTPVGTLQDAQLELGSTATDYEPYSGVAATIDLSETPLRSLPDGTKDELYLTYLRPSSREGWAWYEPTLTQRVAKVEIRSFSSVNTNIAGQCIATTNLGNGYVNVYNVAGDPLRGASNRFTTQQASVNYVTKDHFVYYSGNGYTAFAFANGRFASVAEANAWLAENPIYVHLKLKTPITTTLDPIELPIMQAGTTNIWSDPSTNLSVTYERDRNIVISNLEAAAADLATS